MTTRNHNTLELAAEILKDMRPLKDCHVHFQHLICISNKKVDDNPCEIVPYTSFRDNLVTEYLFLTVHNLFKLVLLLFIRIHIR